MAETNSGGRTVLAVGWSFPSANYVLSIVGAECHVHDGLTGRLVPGGADHAAVIQQAIDLAGVGGVLAFRTGDYSARCAPAPLARQSWQLPFSCGLFDPPATTASSRPWTWTGGASTERCTSKTPTGAPQPPRPSTWMASTAATSQTSSSGTITGAWRSGG